MRKKRSDLFLVLLADVLVAVLILLALVYFLILRPAMSAESIPAATAAVASPTEQAQPEETPTGETDKTEWQIKFAEHFSDEVELTENSYRSPTVSVTVNTVETENSRGQQVVYHAADVYIADMSCFVTHTANNELKYFSVQDVETMDLEADAILSISGDLYSYQSSGFLMRNSQLYKNDEAYCDICVLFSDGVMGCYSHGTYTNEEIIEAGAVQIWNFGPSLLDAEGKAIESFSVSSTVAMTNPRSALGYYEPGHYCFLVVDGRQEASAGMTLPELAELFEQLGCSAAYNLDGGGSAVMLFNHERASSQSNGADRQLGDIIVIKESERAE